MEEVEISYYGDGSICRKTYYRGEDLHRDFGPAEIWYNRDGSVKLNVYYEDNRLHRSNGPAMIWYYPNGVIRTEKYFNYGNRRIPPSILFFFVFLFKNCLHYNSFMI